jgi:hypothetical protein
MYVCMYACVYVCMCLCKYVCMHICVYVSRYVWMYGCIYFSPTLICLSIHAYTHIYINMYILYILHLSTFHNPLVSTLHLSTSHNPFKVSNDIVWLLSCVPPTATHTTKCSINKMSLVFIPYFYHTQVCQNKPTFDMHILWYMHT